MLMRRNSWTAIATTFLLSCSCLCFCLVKPSYVYIYHGCSQEKYPPGTTPFESNLNSLLSSAVSSTSQSSYNAFSIGNDTSPDSAIFGLYQCRGDLKLPDCSECVRSAVSQIGLACPYSYGASLQLEGCYVRYEHVDFLGRPDTSLRYNKCSKREVTDDAEFPRRRDTVLAELRGDTGFHVTFSGSVSGFGQCLGDLSSSDCSACISDAVNNLKTLCGSAAAGDVFLAQCHARYWASGYYNYASESSSGDRVGKAVAVIIGVVAALSVLVVLLSLCKRAMG
ncbi:hypothetical protein MLD38_013913 [Melastoma candidum]|uniref:Uncharacterized protein n=1 Tax=Melastoma candidum TaxID=119954 RepID=A0ACB9RCZ3_9MYRT|nr:hypothetical protein MLD38_013913 [Melastoma candidum]